MFLQHTPLGLHNVLDYFALSDFYDRSCNNAICKMRQEDLSNMVYDLFIYLFIYLFSVFVYYRLFLF